MSGANRVLVVDDENVVCSSCARVLEQEGYEVSLVTDGQAGVERACQENFDAVIVDLKLPGLGGMEVLRIIKRNRPDVRVIVITGYSSVSTAVEAMHLGASDYLAKPFTPDELAERVNQVLCNATTSRGPRVEKSEVLRGVPLPSEAEQVTGRVAAGIRILLAGSNAEEMAALRECLSSEPWQIRTPESHEEIIELIRAREADVLITGIDVLGMKVYDLLREIKKLESNIPILVASSDPSLELARKVHESGIFFYLMEPFDPDEVRAAVRDAVKKAAILRRQSQPVPPRTSLVRSVRTVTRSGRRVGFVILGELVDESSTLYREFVAELKRRAMPVHTELARETLTAKEFPRYLEQDDRVILVTPFETGTANGQIVIYTQEEFKELASKEQQSRLSQVAYPEVLRWLMVQGIAPEVKIVCLPGKPFASDKAGEAASRIINEGLA